MIVLFSMLAQAQSITGGVGLGLFAGGQAIERPGAHAVGSIEVAQLVPEVPWFGLGAELEVGAQPPWCTTCSYTGSLRLGAGPLFRRKAGAVLVGARYAIFGPRRGLRPFVLTRGVLPVARGSLRPFLWAEGLRGTEFGAGIEVGFAVRDGRVEVFPKARPPKPAEPAAPVDPPVPTDQ